MTWYCVGLVAFIDEFTFEVCHFIGIALGSDLSAATMAYHGATCHGLRVEWVKRARGGEGAGNKVEEYRLPQLLVVVVVAVAIFSADVCNCCWPSPLDSLGLLVASPTS